MHSKAGIAVVAAIWLGYTGVKKLFSGNGHQLEPIFIEKILRELECQMFIACSHFALVVQNRIKQNETIEQRKIKTEGLKQDMNKVFEDKKKKLLAKYDISPEDFSRSLQQIASGSIDCRLLQQSMDHMMEQALLGKQPDSNVPPEYRKEFPPQKLIGILREMLTSIACTIFRDYKARLQSGMPHEDFEKLMNRIDIQSIKQQQLKKQKFSKPKDNNPNMTFNKLIEQYKKADASVKNRLKHLELKYQEVIENISIHISTLTEEDILNMMMSINITLQEDKSQNKINKSNLTSGPLSKISQTTEEQENQSPNSSLNVRSLKGNRSMRLEKKNVNTESAPKLKRYSELFSNRSINPYMNSHMKTADKKKARPEEKS